MALAMAMGMYLGNRNRVVIVGGGGGGGIMQFSLWFINNSA